jgi:uncharacterized C2H2 Zn-finger protein
MISESKSLAIYNCQTCMFITRNKKDYERHIRSKKHLVNDPSGHLSILKPTVIIDDNDTLDQKPPMCPNCHKIYKFRTSVYSHMKKCGVPTVTPKVSTPVTVPTPGPAPAPSAPQHETFTPEQIQYILMENKILKELLKNAIHSSASGV